MTLGCVIEALRATPVDVGLGPEVWARYAELLRLEKPTVGQQREFVAVAKQLGIVEPVAELHKAVICAAEACEKILRDNDEAKAKAAELAALRAEAAARKALLDESIRLKWRLEHNDFPEAKIYAKARDRCGRIATATTELAAIKSCFPELVSGGVPITKAGPWAALPHAILVKATENKIFPLLTKSPTPPVIE